MQLLVNLHRDYLRDYQLDGTPRGEIRGAGLQGARCAPILLDAADQAAICGATFVRGAAWPFLAGHPASLLTGEVIELGELWGQDGITLRERLLEADRPAAQLDILEELLLLRVDARDRPLEMACQLLEAGSSVEHVRDRLGLSPRQLINRFRARVGLAPKLFARVARFQRALHDSHRPSATTKGSWADLALRHGYSDQAHFVRELRAFAGTTPTSYRARSEHDLNHSPVEEAL